METREKLLEIMGQYTTDNIGTADPLHFKKTIKGMAEIEDWHMEGYRDCEVTSQRDHSIKFVWGHNHDFGDFHMEGILGDRHIDLIETFVDDFDLPLDLNHKRVLDVGAWCGGTSLLLAGMGANVEVVEEVKKYRNCIKYLCRMFGLKTNKTESNTNKPPGIFVKRHTSLYSIRNQNRFDYIIFPGVLYHLSDPLVALRILFNALKDDGELYGETMVQYSALYSKSANYEFRAGKGNNWFVPNDNGVIKMAEAVGFEVVDGCTDRENEDVGRSHFKLRRNEWKPMLRSGLSRRVR